MSELVGFNSYTISAECSGDTVPDGRTVNVASFPAGKPPVIGWHSVKEWLQLFIDGNHGNLATLA